MDRKLIKTGQEARLKAMKDIRGNELNIIQ